MRQTNCPSINAVQWYLGWSFDDVVFCFTRLRELYPTMDKKEIGNELLTMYKQSKKLNMQMAAVTAVVLANRVESAA